MIEDAFINLETDRSFTEFRDRFMLEIIKAYSMTPSNQKGFLNLTCFCWEFEHDLQILRVRPQQGFSLQFIRDRVPATMKVEQLICCIEKGRSK